MLPASSLLSVNGSARRRREYNRCAGKGIGESVDLVSSTKVDGIDLTVKIEGISPYSYTEGNHRNSGEARKGRVCDWMVSLFPHVLCISVPQRHGVRPSPKKSHKKARKRHKKGIVNPIKMIDSLVHPMILYKEGNKTRLKQEE